MAEVNGSLDLTASMQDAYTVPVAKKATVMMLWVARVDNGNDVDATVQWTDDSDTDKVTRLCFEYPLVVGSGIAPLIGILTLEAGDKIQAKASAAGDAELTFCVLEDDA